MELKIEYLPVGALKPYERNTRKHTKADLAKIEESIRRFGFDDPIGVWGPELTIVEGHGRLQAAQALGMETVPCIRLDHLSEERRREYAIAHNRIAELSAWDFSALRLETEALGEPILKEWRLDELEPLKAEGFFRAEDKEAAAESTEEYDRFTEKFKPKKTTDDCYTPPEVYDAVADWVAGEYGLNKANFVRPFYPGGDYRNYPYAAGQVVVDNPPFSILAEIECWYLKKGIPFFLFAPALTPFNAASTGPGCCCLCAGVSIVYDNGAVVATSFVTSLEPEDTMARTAPELTAAVQAVVDRLAAEGKTELRRNDYPDQVVTAALMQKWSRYGVDFRVRRGEGLLIDALDAQKEVGRSIFGHGLLLSERAAAERAAAERAAAERAAAERAAATSWQLSERERKLSAELNGKARKKRAAKRKEEA